MEQTALAAPSLVFFPRVGTYSLYHKQWLCFRSRAPAREKNPARSSRPLMQCPG